MAAVLASSIVIAVPKPLLLLIVSAPVNKSKLVTPVLPVAHDPKLGVVPPRRHWLEVPAVTCFVRPAASVYKTPPFELKGERVRLVPTVAPPVKLTAVAVVAPRPVTVSRVSASDVIPEEEDVEEIVIVEPDLESVVLPEPCRVTVPVRSLTLETKFLLFKETVGFWPPLTVIPVPPATE